jgi:hypothetical protein
MARKKAETAPQAEETTVRLISASKLKSLLNSAQKASEDCSEITGALGEEIKAAIEKHHLHRKAFNAVKGLMSWSPEKLREFKDHFDYYWEASGLEKKADSAPRLPMDDGEETDNVHRLQPAAE